MILYSYMYRKTKDDKKRKLAKPIQRSHAQLQILDAFFWIPIPVPYKVHSTVEGRSRYIFCYYYNTVGTGTVHSMYVCTSLFGFLHSFHLPKIYWLSKKESLSKNLKTTQFTSSQNIEMFSFMFREHSVHLKVAFIIVNRKDTENYATD